MLSSLIILNDLNLTNLDHFYILDSLEDSDTLKRIHKITHESKLLSDSLHSSSVSMLPVEQTFCKVKPKSCFFLSNITMILLQKGSMSNAVLQTLSGDSD